MDVTLPNGLVIRGIPEGTNKWTVAEKAIKSGLARPEDFGQESANPTEGMSGLEKFRAGYGKAAVDLARGAGQMLGLVNRQDVANSRALDAPLMATGAGKAGDIVGSIADALPAAAIPGAGTVGGAAAIGAGLGLLQPSTSTGETLTNTGMGGALGAGGVLAARGASALYRGGKAVLAPFFKGGQDRAAAGAMQAFAGGPTAAAEAAQNIENGLAAGTLPGAQPTAAELANNAGLSQLERTLTSNPEVLTRISKQTAATKDAALSALNDIAGNGQVSKAEAFREAATAPLYKSAMQQKVAPDAELISLLQRPSMKKAWGIASDIAAESGQSLPQNMTDVSGQTLQYLKMAMDDMTKSPEIHGIGSKQLGAIRDTKLSFVNWLQKNIPDYRAADRTYKWLSGPINQAEVGAALRNKFQPALADYGATSGGRAAAFAQALREGDQTAATALGQPNATLEGVMSPNQMMKLQQIARQLARRANAEGMGRAAGSNTAQNLASQNVVRQFLGPLGLPESTMQRAANQTLVQSLMRPYQFTAQLGEPQILKKLAEGALDPRTAARLLRMGINPQQASLLLRNQQLIAPALASGAYAARQ